MSDLIDDAALIAEASAVRGGFSSMVLLGTLNHEGVFKGEFRSELLEGGNGNPANMLQRVRRLLGKDVLFLVERSFNRNVVVYKLRRTASGDVNVEDPVEVFWLMFDNGELLVDEVGEGGGEEEDGSSSDEDEGKVQPDVAMHTEDLTRVERTLAYGLNVTPGGVNGVNGGVPVFQLGIRALRGEPLRLFEHPRHGWCVGIVFCGEPLILERVMAYTERRSFGLWPTVKQMHVITKTSVDQRKTLHFRT